MNILRQHMKLCCLFLVGQRKVKENRANQVLLGWRGRGNEDVKCW